MTTSATIAEPISGDTAVQQYSPENLKKLVKDSGLSRREFAAMLGISHPAIKRCLLPTTSPYHNDMPAPVYELALLLTDNHPRYRLVPRGLPSAEKEKES